MMVERAWTDQRIEDILGNLLRAGVGLSAFVVFCGAIIYLAQHGHSPADYRVFRGRAFRPSQRARHRARRPGI